MFKQVTIRVVVFAIIIVVLNLLYKFSFYEKDLRDNCKELLDIKTLQAETDVFYFGESSNITFTEQDSTKMSISGLTNLFYPSLTITNINKYATHVGIYKQWLNAIDLKNKVPKAIIVTLNLRSFDAAWIHSKLETPLQQSVVFARPYPAIINRFALSLQAFDNKTDEQREHAMLEDWKTTRLQFPFAFKYTTVREWDDGMANSGHHKADGSFDSEKTILACHYIKSYAFNVNEHNPRVKDLDEMTAWCFKNSIPLYLNLMAENVEYADSLVGKELVFLMKQNRDFLVNRYNKNKCTVVDNLELVKGNYFIDQSWTTEHYSYQGRMAIARHLAQNLEKEFKNNYIKAY